MKMSFVSRCALVLCIVLSLVFSAVNVQPVEAKATAKIMINEIFKGTNLETGNEWVELVLVEDMTAAQLQAYTLGDSQSGRNTKLAIFTFTNMSSIAASFPKGTIIVAGGTGAFTQDTSYNPAGGDWSISLTVGGTYLVETGTNTADFASNDVAWVDNSASTTSVSADGFAMKWASDSGTFVEDVVLGAFSDNTVYALTTDAASASTTASWSNLSSGFTQGLPNGGSNTTWITGLRSGGTGTDSAPTVSSTVPVDNATSVSATADLTINFSEVVTAEAGWITLTCNSTSVPVTVTTASPASSYVVNPDSNLSAGAVCVVNIDNTKIADTDDPVDAMAAAYSFDFTVNATCGSAADFIHDIQGSGATSPVTGQTKTVEGVVVGDYQTTAGLNAFYIQEQDADVDADPLTSEGMLIADGTFGVAVNPGDVVRVSGTVTEAVFSGSTVTGLNTITAVTVCSTGASVSTSTVNFPVTAKSTLEAFEGMLVNIPQSLTVSDVYTLARYGEVGLAVNGRVFQYTNLNLPSVAGNAAYQTEIANRTIILDDGKSAQNPATVIHPAPAGLSAANTLRLGYTLPSGITGVMDNRIGVYRLQPVSDVIFTTTTNERPTSPADAGGTLKVAAMNVLNYFNGPSFPTSRGATSAAEFTRQRDKTISAIVGTGADVVGLMEIENDGYAADSAIQDLVNGLNAAAGAGTYAFINPGTTTLGGDEITVAIVYKPATVTPAGAAAALTTGSFTQETDRRNRPALAQTFTENSSGESFTIVVNHFKSKGSACNSNTTFPFADVDTGDGQGNCNKTRLLASIDLADWLATDPTGQGDDDYLIVGDLNSYAKEDPIRALEKAGFTNLISQFTGADGYSYLYSGQIGYLDHALASPTLAGQVAGLVEWHTNADEPIGLDYNLEYKSVAQQTSYYDTSAFRAADHDPVIVGLNLVETESPDYSDLTATYGGAWHNVDSTLHLGATVASGHSAVGSGTNDGVTPLGAWTVATGGSVEIYSTWGDGATYVTGWIDWNKDGDFDDSGEVIFANEEFATLGETRTIFFSIPVGTDIGAGDAASFNARFRVYDAEQTGKADPQPTGAGGFGEVEDHVFSFSPTAISLQALSARSLSIPAVLSVLVLGLAAALFALRRKF